MLFTSLAQISRLCRFARQSLIQSGANGDNFLLTRSLALPQPAHEYLWKAGPQDSRLSGPYPVGHAVPDEERLSVVVERECRSPVALARLANRTGVKKKTTVVPAHSLAKLN
jgi:hypothetical protein